MSSSSRPLRQPNVTTTSVHEYSLNSLVILSNTTDTNSAGNSLDLAFWYIGLVNWGILDQIISVCGLITNTINILVYVKLGAKDSMNVTLLGLSISDFFSCLTALWMNVTFTPGFAELDLPFSPIGVHDLVATTPHYTFVKITCTITACITIERWFCVSFALKVRQLITTKRMTIITVLIYVTLIGLASPTYYFFKLGWVFDSSRNKSILTGLQPDSQAKVEGYQVFRLFFYSVLPVMLVLIVVIFTLMLVYELKKSSKWRNAATGRTGTTGATASTPSTTSSSARMTSKDNKVTRMVLTISTLFIFCFLPEVFMTVVAVFLPIFQTQMAAIQAFFSFNVVLQNVNSFLNIFIYYNMSSNYKSMFDDIFGLRGKEKGDK